MMLQNFISDESMMHHLLSVRGHLHLVSFEEYEKPKKSQGNTKLLTLFPPLDDMGSIVCKPQGNTKLLTLFPPLDDDDVFMGSIVCKSYGYVGSYMNVS